VVLRFSFDLETSISNRATHTVHEILKILNYKIIIKFIINILFYKIK